MRQSWRKPLRCCLVECSNYEDCRAAVELAHEPFVKVRASRFFLLAEKISPCEVISQCVSKVKGGKNALINGLAGCGTIDSVRRLVDSRMHMLSRCAVLVCSCWRSDLKKDIEREGD